MYSTVHAVYTNMVVPAFAWKGDKRTECVIYDPSWPEHERLRFSGVGRDQKLESGRHQLRLSALEFLEITQRV